MEMIISIEERFGAFNDSRDKMGFEADPDVSLARGLEAAVEIRKYAKDLCQRFGEDVLLPSQVKIIAYLLGFNDPKNETYISKKVYEKEILPLIEEDGRFIASKRGGLAFKIDAVKEAMRRLGSINKLDYTPERFVYARLKV